MIQSKATTICLIKSITIIIIIFITNNSLNHHINNNRQFCIQISSHYVQHHNHQHKSPYYSIFHHAFMHHLDSSIMKKIWKTIHRQNTYSLRLNWPPPVVPLAFQSRHLPGGLPMRLLCTVAVQQQLLADWWCRDHCLNIIIFSDATKTTKTKHTTPFHVPPRHCQHCYHHLN